MRIKDKVDDNINYIKEMNNNSSDIVTRKIKKKNKEVGYIYLESVSSDDKISDFLNKSLVSNISFTNVLKNLQNDIYCSHISTCDNFEEVFYYLASGYTALFIDGETRFIVVETKTTLDRGVSEGSSEPIVRGP